jgi:uncharacterized membrane protein YccC
MNHSSVFKIVNLLMLCLCLFFVGFMVYREAWAGAVTTLLLSCTFGYIAYADFFSKKQ